MDTSKDKPSLKNSTMKVAKTTFPIRASEISVTTTKKSGHPSASEDNYLNTRKHVRPMGKGTRAHDPAPIFLKPLAPRREQGPNHEDPPSNG